MRTDFIVYIEGEPSHFSTFERAARFWDGQTYQANKVVPGGIAIQVYDGDIMVRDGWAIHCMENGVVYISPDISILTMGKGIH